MSTLKSNDELFDVDLQEVTMLVTNPKVGKGRVRVLMLKDDTEKVLKHDDIRALVAAGSMRVMTPGAPKVHPTRQTTPGLHAANALALKIASEVAEHARRRGVSTCAAYEAVKKKRQSEGGIFPSRATVYRYVTAQKKGLPPLHGAANKGNRKPRHTDDVVELIVNVAEAQFLQTESRWSVRRVTELCNIEAQEQGLLTAKQPISRKFVNKVIFENLTTDADYDRMDHRTRAAQKAIAKNRIQVNGVLQRVEQDTVHLPWRVRTAAGDAVNISLVHAIDCSTSVPVGWHFVIGAPRESDGLRCLESVMFSKKDRFAALGLDIALDLYGQPAVLVLDNGPEGKGERFRRAASLGIAIKYCKSRHPHHKPHIERLNRSLKEALETLPGCTRFDGVDGQRDPQELNDLPMTLEELERWVVRWYYEVWANTVLQRLIRSMFSDDRDLGGTPLARHDNIVKRDEYAIPLPPNKNVWQFAMYEHVERTLARTTGITYDNFHFRGPNLDVAIARFGERKVTVLVDPEDFRTVQVLDGDELIELVNIDVTATTPAHSFAEANSMVREATERAGSSGAAAVRKFQKELFERSVQSPVLSESTGKRSAAQRSREVSTRAKAQAAVARASEKPLKTTQQEERADSMEIGSGEVSALPVRNRVTGVAA